MTDEDWPSGVGPPEYDEMPPMLEMMRSHQMECDGESQGGKQEAMPGTKGDGARGPSFLEEINKGISKAWCANALRHAVPGPDFVGIKGMDGAFEEKGLISRAEERGDLVIFNDGYTYYCPTGGGGLTAHNLRTIADELDRRNAGTPRWMSFISSTLMTTVATLRNLTAHRSFQNDR